MFKKKSSKKGRPAKQSTEETSWIVEGIVEYLTSPTWNVPVLNFVESQCDSFTHSEECSLEHTEIHKKYKALVEQLINAYMKELEITEKQFSSACSPTNRDIAQMHRNFEYIWAADDFLIFRRLMASHNVRLQKEALLMLDSGDPSKQFSNEDAEVVTKMLKSSKISLAERKSRKVQEEEDLRLAIEFSKMEMQRLNSIADREKQLLEQAIRLSLESSKSGGDEDNAHISKVKDFEVTQQNSSLTKPISVSHPVLTDISAKSLDKPATYQSPLDQRRELPDPVQQYKSIDGNPIPTKQSVPQQKTSPTSTSTPSLPPLRSQHNMSSADAANAWLDQAMKGIIESPKHSMLSHNSKDTKYGSIDPEELTKRKAYLQAQRDKLLAQKRKERNEELMEFMENKQTDDMPERDAKEEKQLASRRAIAERLKREVINKDK